MSLSRKMFSGHGLAFLSAFVLLTMVRPHWAGASPITYNFTGTVNESIRISGVNAGDPLSGTLSYDTNLIPNPPPDPSNPGSISGYEAPPGTNLISLQVKVGSQTFGIDNPGHAGVLVAHDYSDGFFFGTPSDFFLVSIEDALKQFNFHLTALPGQAFTSTDLPTSLDLTKFTLDLGNGIGFVDNSQLDADFLPVLLDGSITSLTVVPQLVPEPSTLALFTLAIFGYGVRRLNGRELIG